MEHSGRGSGGRITNADYYTAPKKAGTYHVVATSQEDSSQTATVTVPSVSVEISPASDDLGPEQQRQFSAELKETVEKLRLTWSVLEGPASGTITSGGLYTAPATAGTYHVEAISTAGTTIYGEAEVTVLSSDYSQPTASMEASRVEHTGTLLKDGRVLVTGGYDGAHHPLASAEVYK